MTTRNKNPFNGDPFEGFPPPPDPIDWEPALEMILDPFEPARDSKDATDLFTTAEILQSLEQHYGIPQGIVGKAIHSLIPGADLVKKMNELGYRAENTGGMQLQWLLKKKTILDS